MRSGILARMLASPRGTGLCLLILLASYLVGPWQLRAQSIELGLQARHIQGSYNLEKRLFEDAIFDYDGAVSRARVFAPWSAEKPGSGLQLNALYRHRLQQSQLGIGLGLDSQSRAHSSVGLSGNGLLANRQIRKDSSLGYTGQLFYLWSLLDNRVRVGPRAAMRLQSNQYQLSETVLGTYLLNSTVSSSNQSLLLQADLGLRLEWDFLSNWSLQLDLNHTLTPFYSEHTSSQFSYGTDRLYREQASSQYEVSRFTLQTSLGYSFASHWMLMIEFSLLESQVRYPGYINLPINLTGGARSLDQLEMLTDTILYARSGREVESHLGLGLVYKFDIP